MSLERWKQFLRNDPTRWLLENDDPSILLWYQLDIANRPTDAPGVTATRERVLYSDPVQKIFAAQDGLGFWGDPESPAHPDYTATLWNLALLAELGIPPTSRRARNACEFILQNFLDDDDTFRGLNATETGYLIRALGYFNHAADPRVLASARALARRLDTPEARLAALWGWRSLLKDVELERAAATSLEQVLTNLGQNAARQADYTFPHFNPRDELFILRVLAEYDAVGDPHAAPYSAALVQKQNDRAQWVLGRSPDGKIVTPLETPGKPSRWITLNALRIIVKLVLSGG